MIPSRHLLASASVLAAAVVAAPRARADVPAPPAESVAAEPVPEPAPPAKSVAAEPAPPAESVAAEPAEEVRVRGASETDRRRTSAEAVKVVETTRARREAADLGEVLARTEGVGVQRSGGLGSGMRFSLNGLTDDQVRFFLDGVPLELAGFPWGIANVPVALVKRVDIYRGVVPIRYGADALGGAVDLVTDADPKGTHGAVTYQLGSFGTHRATLAARTFDPPTGLFARVAAFLDHADNDYPIDAQVADASGRLRTARVRRFHDAYDAAGANVEAGFARRRWAKKLLVRAFVADYAKDLQNNPVGTVPYGAATYERFTAGGSVRWEHQLGPRVPVDVVAGYSHAATYFRDLGTCVYDWFGACGRARPQPGELEGKPHDQVVWDRSLFARANVGLRLADDHTLKLTLAPTAVVRTGDERRPLDATTLDPLTAWRRLFTMVSGLEATSRLFDARLENIAFVKDYLQAARAEEAFTGAGTFRERTRDTHRLGAGDALRYRFGAPLWAKASYELATRLPSALETFGDGVLVSDNLTLQPETSHNVNLGVTLDLRDTPMGAFRLDANGFLRVADQLIVLLGSERLFTYQNVYGARVVGVEASGGWSAPGEWLALDGNVTWQDFRNTEDSGTFAKFEGDRIPNRPWLFANGSARVTRRRLLRADDELSLGLVTRWVHGYYRSWESVGAKDAKQRIPAQLVHSAALTYLARADVGALAVTLEVQNLGDEKVFDFYGVQRPGRALYAKTSLEF